MAIEVDHVHESEAGEEKKFLAFLLVAMCQLPHGNQQERKSRPAGAMNDSLIAVVRLRIIENAHRCTVMRLFS